MTLLAFVPGLFHFHVCGKLGSALTYYFCANVIIWMEGEKQGPEAM